MNWNGTLSGGSQYAQPKKLEVGRNYGILMGFTGDNTMIYNGGISWTATRADGQTITADSQAQTDAVAATIAG